MEAQQQTRSSTAGSKTPVHVRHRPERTLLYQIVEQHYPRFLARLAGAGRTLPRHVQREFEDYLKCGRLEHGFLRVRCEGCHAEKLVAFSCKRRGFCPSCGARRMTESAAHLVDEVLPSVPIRQWVLSVPYALRFLFARDPQSMSAALGIVYRTIEAHLLHKAGLRRSEGECGAVTLIQRFGSALNLNVHFHMLIPDGVYLRGAAGPVFRPVGAPTGEELQSLVQRISGRIGRQLERRGILVRDAESSHLEREWDTGEDALPDLQGHSITYRIAVGPHQGRKAMMLQTLAPRPEEREGERLGRANGFSLHAGVGAQAAERTKLERLCRYIGRAAVSEERISLTAQGNVRYALKSAYRDGTTHVVFEPEDFLSRLAALVPSPRVNLTRFHGVFAPHSELRAQIVAQREASEEEAGAGQGCAGGRAASLGWARRLKRVFAIDVERCEHCGGKLRILAAIEDEELIGKILRHVGIEEDSVHPLARAGPTGTGLFD